MNSDEVTAECEVAAKATEEEEELLQLESPKERIVASLGGWVVTLGILFSQQVALEPGPTFLFAVVTSVAAICWDVYGRALLLAASLRYD
jgi:hypothetical protein